MTAHIRPWKVGFLRLLVKTRNRGLQSCCAELPRETTWLCQRHFASDRVIHVTARV